MPAAKNCKPAVNIRENENEFELDIMVPGMKKEDFKINVESDILTVSAEVTTKDEVKDKEYVRKEFYFGSFNRRFSMPDSVNADKIEANYTNGILVVSLPKKEEAKPQPVRMIEIA
jgi:HSP20 family protein